MRKVIVYLSFIIALLGSATSQASLKPRIPQEVKDYISSNYPKAKHLHWQKEEGVFIANFVNENTETILYLSDKGELMNKLTEITAYSDLPEDIRAKVDPKKVVSGEKLEGNQGEVFYIFEVTKPKGKIQELVFDGSGKQVENVNEVVEILNNESSNTPQ